MTDDEDQHRALLERLAAADAATLKRLTALLEDAREDARDSGASYLAHLPAVAASDVRGLVRAERSYGDSWKRRGGSDAFMMLARKWDRIEKRLAGAVPATAEGAGADAYDIFGHIAADRRADGVIDDVRDLRRYLLLVDAETAARAAAGNASADSGRGFLDQLEPLAQADLAALEAAERSYGSSWKRRAGIGAFMMLARKWDRIEQRVANAVEPSEAAPGAARYNVLEHVAADRRSEGVLEDIRDLRRYLLLVEAEMAARGVVEIGTARDDREEE